VAIDAEFEKNKEQVARHRRNMGFNGDGGGSAGSSHWVGGCGGDGGDCG